MVDRLVGLMVDHFFVCLFFKMSFDINWYADICLCVIQQGRFKKSLGKLTKYTVPILIGFSNSLHLSFTMFFMCKYIFFNILC